MNRAAAISIAAVIAATGLVVPSGGGAVPVPASPSAPVLNAPPALDWSRCFGRQARQARRDTGDTSIRFECASLRVPLDHDEPDGPTIEVAVVRLPARGNADFSLITNPGGPGGSGVDFLVNAGPYIYADSIRNRFDIVGFDPRGIGRSSVLRCARRPFGFFAAYPDVPYPVGTKELRQWRTGDRAAVQGCVDRDPRILAHMSTANVARDMDLLRQAVGDEGLTYQGFSYGTYLGATYANLFPDSIRAMVVDAVLDPVAWTGKGALGRRPLSARLGSATSANATLAEFMRLCGEAGPRRCALAPKPGQRWKALIERARTEPILYLQDVGDDVVIVEETDRTIISAALGVMYNTGGWQSFANYLAFLEEQPAGRAARTREAPFPEEPTYPGIESFLGVVCSETNHPDSFSAWARHADNAPEPFGRTWAWGTSACAFWPVLDEDRYTGPYDAETSAPILVASTTHDPATPYAGAKALRRILPNSVLLTVEGWGHGAYQLSQCGDRVITAYITKVTVPDDDVTCRQNGSPFPRVRNRGVSARDRLVDAITQAPLLPGR